MREDVYEFTTVIGSCFAVAAFVLIGVVGFYIDDLMSKVARIETDVRAISARQDYTGEIPKPHATGAIPPASFTGKHKPPSPIPQDQRIDVYRKIDESMSRIRMALEAGDAITKMKPINPYAKQPSGEMTSEEKQVQQPDIPSRRPPSVLVCDCGESCPCDGKSKNCGCTIPTTPEKN